MKTWNTFLSRSALCLALTSFAVSAASAAVMNTRPVSVSGSTLQSYLNSLGQTINVNTDQAGNGLWTTTVSHNSTFTIKLALGGPLNNQSIGIYNDGGAATRYQIFPATAGPGWFCVTSFDVGTPGHVVSNLFDANAMWQGQVSYTGVNSSAFGFYVDNSAGAGVCYGEDDENTGTAPYNAMNLVFPATGTSVGSWWIAFQSTPKESDGSGEFTDALVFLESVNGPTPVQPTTWGALKNQFRR